MSAELETFKKGIALEWMGLLTNEDKLEHIGAIVPPLLTRFFDQFLGQVAGFKPSIYA